MKAVLRKTHEERKKKVESVRTQLQSMLNWDDLQYCEFQMEMGMKYLDRIAGPGEIGVKELSQSKLYWNWWKNHWNRRDQEFLNDLVVTIASGLEEIRQEYMYWHSPYNITVRPHKPIMEESFSKMIGTFIDGFHKTGGTQ